MQFHDGCLVQLFQVPIIKYQIRDFAKITNLLNVVIKNQSENSQKANDLFKLLHHTGILKIDL